MTKEFAALIFIGLLVLVVLVYAVFSARERSGAVEARLAAMSGLGGANNRLAKNAQLAAFLRQPECQATILVMMGALLLGWFLKLSIAAEVLLLVMVGAASWIIVRRWRLDRARRAFLSRFPEAVDNFTRSIQAGIPVDRALKILGEAYDDEFGRRVLKLCREMKVGLPFREALGNFADELDNPIIRYNYARSLYLEGRAEDSLAQLQPIIDQVPAAKPAAVAALMKLGRENDVRRLLKGELDDEKIEELISAIKEKTK